VVDKKQGVSLYQGKGRMIRMWYVASICKLMFKGAMDVSS
jgi:hypothetical protein